MLNLKNGGLMKLIDWLGPSGAFAYVICMFIYPWLAGAGSWQYVQDVWDRWQTLNTGLLAFLASIVALKIARLNEHKAQERNFRASRAMLPAAFSEMQQYLRACATVFKNAWEGEPLAPELMPISPEGAKEIFRDCINSAEPVIGNYLADLLAKLQVHEARLGELVGSRYRITSSRQNLINYIAELGKIHALISKQFEFARGEAEFDTTPLLLNELLTSYRIMQILIDQIYVSETINLQRRSSTIL